MSASETADTLLRRRLAAQRLTSQTRAGDPAAVARAVIGLQAQDVRAAGLAIRARTAGVSREDVDIAPLVRTWTVRGTVHLIAADDLPWLDALTGPRNRRRFDALMIKRGNLETANAIRPAALEILADGPLTRAKLIERLDERGLPSLGPLSINVLMPWLASTGEVAGLADGSFRRAEPPPPVAEEEALATLGRRYLEGYGPAGPEDLARWSGLPITACRRALALVADAEPYGELLELPSPGPAPEPPSVRMLGAFDTAMLGWRSRETFVVPADDQRLLPGGGVIRPVVLVAGRAVATWKLDGSGRRRRVVIDRFGAAPPERELRAEIAAVGAWLDLDLEPSS